MVTRTDTLKRFSSWGRRFAAMEVLEFEVDRQLRLGWWRPRTGPFAWKAIPCRFLCL